MFFEAYLGMLNNIYYFERYEVISGEKYLTYFLVVHSFGCVKSRKEMETTFT